jgi:hypothetical protein
MAVGFLQSVNKYFKPGRDLMIIFKNLYLNSKYGCWNYITGIY